MGLQTPCQTTPPPVCFFLLAPSPFLPRPIWPAHQLKPVRDNTKLIESVLSWGRSECLLKHWNEAILSAGWPPAALFIQAKPSRLCRAKTQMVGQLLCRDVNKKKIYC